MHIPHPLVILTVACSSLANAAPTVATDRCNPIDAVYAILRGPLKAQASSLCLSFLGGDKTTQQTQTTTVTGAAVTATITGAAQTETTGTATTTTSTTTGTITQQQPEVTVTQTVTTTAATRTIYQKRAAHYEQRGIPPALAAFASARISSACRCIVTPTTRTITTTQTQNVAGAPVTQTQNGGTVTVTQTTTVSTITEQDVTVTAAGATRTETTTTTVTPILVKPKICNAGGLPGANAFNYDANFNTNQAACIASCKTDNRCLSTGFYIVTDPSNGSQTGTCRKYDKSVTDTADLGFGYYNFNDKAC